MTPRHRKGIDFLKRYFEIEQERWSPGDVIHSHDICARLGLTINYERVKGTRGGAQQFSGNGWVVRKNDGLEPIYTLVTWREDDESREDALVEAACRAINPDWDRSLPSDPYLEPLFKTMKSMARNKRHRAKKKAAKKAEPGKP